MHVSRNNRLSRQAKDKKKHEKGGSDVRFMQLKKNPLPGSRRELEASEGKGEGSRSLEGGDVLKETFVKRARRKTGGVWGGGGGGTGSKKTGDDSPSMKGASTGPGQQRNDI